MSTSNRSTREPDLYLHDAIDAFKRDGYCILDDAFDPATIDRCCEILAERKATPGKHLVHDCLDRDPDLFLSLAANDPILDFCEVVMGPFVQLDGLTIVGLPPAGPDGNRRVSGWHRDPWAQVPRSSAFERPLAINVLIYLQDLDDNTGPLRVCPGSHREPMVISQDDRRRPHPREVPLHLRRGSTVLIHNNLVHTGTSPQPDVDERAFVSVFYNLSWLKQTVSLSGPNYEGLVADARRTGNVRRLRLLGLDPTLLERNDTGFLVADEAQWVRWILEDRSGV